MTEPQIECRALTHAYHRAGERLVVLDRLDLTIAAGDFAVLMGPSGSGKSTLLNLIGGLDRAESGTLRIQGVDIATLPERTMAAWRAQTIGFIFQFYHLLPMLDAICNVELPLLLTSLDRRRRRTNATKALELVGLADRANHKPDQLSGGQQQRVAIARAIVADPAILICDEPTGDLDRATADEILALLTTLNRELGKTIVMVTHDPKAAGYGSRVLHMDKGALVAVAA
jgi:putative ABC transport system ATP-binding protein